jgi:hypothetical protein
MAQMWTKPADAANPQVQPVAYFTGDQRLIPPGPVFPGVPNLTLPVLTGIPAAQIAPQLPLGTLQPSPIVSIPAAQPISLPNVSQQSPLLLNPLGQQSPLTLGQRSPVVQTPLGQLGTSQVSLPQVSLNQQPVIQEPTIQIPKIIVAQPAVQPANLIPQTTGIQASLTSKTPVVSQPQPFPYKKEFMNPDELWNNLLTMNLVQVKVVQLVDEIAGRRPWSSIPKNYQWKFLGQTVAIITPKATYNAFDKLTDWFTEPARIQANVHGCPAPIEYYQQNYDQVVRKAQELQQQWNDHPSFRYFMREAVYALTSECTTFKIGASRKILEYFKAKKVLDPSSGWSDRMLGAAAAGVDVYHGVDPNPALRSGYDEVIQFVSQRPPQNQLGPIEGRFSVLTADFLKVNLEPESYDTVFTSPPFWNFEQYSTAPGQSIQGISTVEQWTTDFLYPYLTKAWNALCVGGHMILYISDVKTGRYVANMARYMNKELHAKFLGIIGLCGDEVDLSYAYPLWIFQKQ